MYDSQLVQEELIESEDYLLEEAYHLALEGSVGELFSYQEPEIIRQKYYTGKRPSQIDDEITYTGKPISP